MSILNNNRNINFYTGIRHNKQLGLFNSIIFTVKRQQDELLYVDRTHMYKD